LQDSSGNLVFVDFPGGTGTRVTGVNNTGDIVGTYQIAGGTTRSFLATPCPVTVSPADPQHRLGVETGSITITPRSDCSWTAYSPDPAVTLSATSGTGSANLTYTVAASGGSTQRTFLLNVGGQTFTIRQGGLNCTYTLSSTTANVQAQGGIVDVQVT